MGDEEIAAQVHACGSAQAERRFLGRLGKEKKEDFWSQLVSGSRGEKLLVDGLRARGKRWILGGGVSNKENSGAGADS